MAYSVNKVILLGNLGRDPELRYTQSGKAVASLSLATSTRDKEGQDRTEWHRVTAWDKLAELVARLCSKGTKVYVEGRLQTREYTDGDGNRRFSTEIVAREMVFLTASGEETGRGSGGPSNAGQRTRYNSDDPPGPGYSDRRGPGGRDDDEDIPF